MVTVNSQTKGFSLTQIDTKDISGAGDGIRCFIVERNEVTRLPYLLQYYRDLGVSSFFVVDDKSSDGSREFLIGQPDCYVFDPSNSFREARAGVDWQNILLDEFGTGYWTIVADADELLVYPRCEEVRLPEFCAFLDSEGSTSFFAYMLDMYPEGHLGSGVCVPGKPFYEICPYFDSDYNFRKKGTFSSAIEELPRVRVAGGPRQRKFYPFQKRTDFMNRLIIGIIIKGAEKLKFWKGDKPHYMPALIKMPLVKWGAGCKRLSNHVIVNPLGHVSSITGVLLHFKFFADFHQKVLSEIERGEHFQGSMEYKRYMRYASKNPNFTFMYEGSRRYNGSPSLLEENLIRTSDKYEAYVASLRKRNSA